MKDRERVPLWLLLLSLLVSFLLFSDLQLVEAYQQNHPSSSYPKSSSSYDDTVVNTKNGPVKGVIENSHRAFKGIPYAVSRSAFELEDRFDLITKEYSY